MLEGGRAVLVLSLEAGHEVVDELRGRRVVADDDEAGGHFDAALVPKLEGLRIVPVKGLQGGLKFGRDVERIEFAALGPAAPPTVQDNICAPLKPIPTSPTGWLTPNPSGSFPYGIRLYSLTPSRQNRGWSGRRNGGCRSRTDRNRESNHRVTAFRHGTLSPARPGSNAGTPATAACTDDAHVR